MLYINALELIDLCVNNNLIQESNGKILVYRSGTTTSKEGWYANDKDIVAKELMKDDAGCKILVSALNKKNIEFIPTNYLCCSR